MRRFGREFFLKTFHLIFFFKTRVVEPLGDEQAKTVVEAVVEDVQFRTFQKFFFIRKERSIHYSGTRYKQ
jgi:hypothetical protein